MLKFLYTFKINIKGVFIMFRIVTVMTTTIIIVAFIRILMKRADNGFDKSVNAFLERENNANSINKDFNTLNITFVKPSKTLPFREYENIPEYKNIIKRQQLVKRKLDLEMIKIPSNLTNTELKEMYGKNNFDKIFKLEDHYNVYVRSLFDWAKELYNLNNIYDCKKVLLEAVRLEANISQVYILLSQIYLKENDKNSILKLRDTVENMDLSLKSKVLEEISKYI